MEELMELRTYIQEGRYAEALRLVDEMEAMSREDKIHKIRSYARILLLHLIKQQAEQHSTRSWEISIRNAAREIAFVNKRRKAGGHYLGQEELLEVVREAYPSALELASLEAFEGTRTERQLSELVQREDMEQKALEIIESHQS